MKINPNNNTVIYEIGDLKEVNEAIKSIAETMMELKPGKVIHDQVMMDLKDIRIALSLTR